VTVPRANATIAQRVKALEEAFRVIKLMPSTTQTDVAPSAAVKGAVWIDSSAGNEPKVWDGTDWVPVRDETIAVAQTTANEAAADVAPLVPLTDLAAITEGTTISGATVESTPAGGAYAVLNHPDYPGEVVIFSGNAAETIPARFLAQVPTGLQGQTTLLSPKLDGASRAALILTTDAVALGGDTHAQIDGHEIILNTFGTGVVKIQGSVTDADLSDPSNTFPANAQPVQVSELTDQTPVTSTTFIAGSPVCGTAFTAPATGKVYITVSGHLQGNNAGSYCYLGFEVRNGAVVGSGTVVTAADQDVAVAAGQSAAAIARTGGSREALITGLTPGASYNVQTMHKVIGTQGTVHARAVLVKPVL